MTAPECVLSSEEVARRGKEIYECSIRDKVEPARIGALLAIDVLTGEYDIVPRFNDLAQYLYDKGPSTTRYIMRIGYPGVFKWGGGAMKPNPR